MSLSQNHYLHTVKRALTTLVLGLVLPLAGCIANQGYRTQLPSQPPGGSRACDTLATIPATCSVQMVHSAMGPTPVDVPVAFVEFDDVGQAFNTGQITAAENVIQAARQSGPVMTVLFVHGWKNNASDDSGNVPGFRQFLQLSQLQLPSIRLVGIYFGWRGGTTNAAVVKELTYWNRRDKATYIPGSNMSEALLRMARATKGPDYSSPESKFVVVGHSFGGLVLERTVTQDLTRRTLENPKARLFADLLVFVNEAAAATEAIQLLTALRSQMPQEYPMILSMTSQGDLATGVVLPVGQGASLFKTSLRDYGPPYANDPFGIAKQRSYYLRSAAHIPGLQSHVIAADSPAIRAAYDVRGYTCVSIPFLTGRGSANYYVVKIANAANTTPYWIMQMPRQIVPDHSNIFRPQFYLLLQSFLLRQAGDAKPDPNTCYSVPPAQLPDMRNMRGTTSAR
jgi:hypothetical protein